MTAKKSWNTPVRQAFLSAPATREASGEKAVAVAVSGGPDSMALCRLLSLWAAHEERSLVHALTVDHGLRPESAREARQVGERVKGWPQIRHKILRAPKQDLDPAEGRLMERAREIRYRLMADYCRKAGIRKLFLAHHRDDQAETFLFRLAKGSGLDGLSSMQQVQAYGDGFTLLRPLLDLAKEDLMAFCRAEKIPYIEDPTNRNPGFARNRLRQAHDVLAREGLTSKRLAVTAGRLARARKALDFYADEAFQNALLEKTDRSISLRYAALVRQPAETRLRVLLRAMEDLRKAGSRDPGYGPRRESLEDLVEALFSPGYDYKKRTLGGFMISFNRKKDMIVVEAEKKRESANSLVRRKK